MKKLLFVLALSTGMTLSAPAQEPAPSADTTTPPALDATQSPNAPKKKKSEKSPWEFHVTTRSVWDSNIEQDSDGHHSRGFILETGVDYNWVVPHGTVLLSYDRGQHSYTNTAIWDRTSHDFEVAWENKLSRQWVSETIAKVALQDASDDGDIRNEFSVEQRLEYRLTPRYRVRLDGEIKHKRKSAGDRDKDAYDPKWGVLLENRYAKDGRARLGYYSDLNNAKDDRRSYRRSEYVASIRQDMGKSDTVEAKAAFQRRRYTQRWVATGTGAERRLDWYWEIEAAWKHSFSKNVELGLDYTFETRNSNDKRRQYEDHLVGTSLTYAW